MGRRHLTVLACNYVKAELIDVENFGFLVSENSK